MPKQPSLRFSHKEIAVIFSLFVFISMLMFTVGILVGKGLTMAKFEADGGFDLSHRQPAGLASQPLGNSPSEMASETLGNAVTTEPELEPGIALPEDVIDNEPPRTAEPLRLVPKKKSHRSALGDSLLESKKRFKDKHVLKNPKVQALLEGGKTPSRKPNSLIKTPSSAASGKFTVQIGSYPNKKDAEARVNSLKKLGFPHAYLSAKELGERKATWFRVWLGYFPDFQAAKANAEFLQKKGEVKNYLVRKATKSTS